jgi:hypothetical protein
MEDLIQSIKNVVYELKLFTAPTKTAKPYYDKEAGEIITEKYKEVDGYQHICSRSSVTFDELI